MRSVAFSDDFDITRERTSVDSDGQLFNAEEMQAIREQYEERIASEVERREELEWQVRMALASVRDAELDARRAADQMRKIHATLQSLLGQKPAADEDGPTHLSDPRPAPVLGVAPSVPSTKLAPVAPSITKSRPLPPPLPVAAKNSRGPLPPRPLAGYKRVIA